MQDASAVFPLGQNKGNARMRRTQRGMDPGQGGERTGVARQDTGNRLAEGVFSGTPLSVRVLKSEDEGIVH